MPPSHRFEGRALVAKFQAVGAVNRPRAAPKGAKLCQLTDTVDTVPNFAWLTLLSVSTGFPAGWVIAQCHPASVSVEQN